MTREEQLACLKDRPCDVCKMRTDKGCSSWECVFEQTPDEEKEPCDCISRAELLKAVDTWDKFGCDADSKLVPYKDCYVPYIHYDDVVKAIKGIPSIQPTTKENLVVGDCISRAEAIKAIRNYNVTIEVGRAIGKSQLADIVDSINKVQEKMISELPSIQPKPKMWYWQNNACSNCGIYNASAYKNWCPNCGAKMVEPQESEGVCDR